MRFRFGHLLGVLLVFFITAQLIAAPDRTIAEFKEYVVDKMDGLLTESELDAYAKRVDQDGDGDFDMMDMMKFGAKKVFGRD